MKRLIFVVVFFLSFTSHIVLAACFIATKDGDIRSGPSTRHKIIGHLEKWQVIELARGENWEGDWLRIEKKTEYVDEKVSKKGWSTFMSSGQWGAFESRVDNPNEPIAVIGLLSFTESRGAFVKFTGDEKTRGTEVSKEVIYHPICQKIETEYVHKNIGKVVPGKITDVRIRVMAVRESKGWPKNIQDTVLEGNIKIGMDKYQVLAAWGNPDDINRMVNAYGVSEQWVYGDTYLYFDDGRLRSWQEW